MRRGIAILLILGIVGMCSGCLRKKSALRIVEQIQVQWEEDGTGIRRVYEDPEKMTLILNRIRTLGQRFSADTDPEMLDATIITMTLFYSDQTQRQYQIKPDRYVRVEQAPWQQANPKQVTALQLILQSLPSDTQT